MSLYKKPVVDLKRYRLPYLFKTPKCFAVLQPRKLIFLMLAEQGCYGVAENVNCSSRRIKTEDTHLLKDQATTFTMDPSSKILYFHTIIWLE